MTGSIYEGSDISESSEYESNSDFEDMEVESDLRTPFDTTMSQDQDDAGPSSPQSVDDVSLNLGDEPSIPEPTMDPETMPSTHEASMHPVDEEGIHVSVPYKGQLFDTFEDAKGFYLEYAHKVGFGVRTRDSRRLKARDNMVTRLHLTCDRQGLHVKRTKPADPEKPVARRNTSTQKCGCLAMYRVVLRKDGRWVVNEFHETHNHNPVTPSKRMCMKGRRHMPPAAKSLVEAFRANNLPVGKVAAILDGKSVGFDERDCYNHLGRSKEYKTPVEGDASAMSEFLWKKQTEDPHFFYAILQDKDSRAVNFLWIDGRSKSQWQHFGDVLYFDTTYKKNVYQMPFAPFTGVNHHLQSIQFGCALLLDETEESFVWAFKTWLQGMGGKAPVAMITDQDPAMSKAIARVFPDTRHRYCLWHILKKFPEKLNHVYKKKSKFKKQIKWCIRGFYRVADFEQRWHELMGNYELTGNDWLKKLYAIREKWVPVYHLSTFYAGMNTTGRSEGMNSFYKGFFSRHTTLREFALKNDLCLQRMVDREKKEDYISEHKRRVVDGVLQAKTISSVDSNKFGDTIAINTQPPLVDCSQATNVSQTPPTNESQDPPTNASQPPPTNMSQAPPSNASQVPPINAQAHLQIGNPRISKPKGREKDVEKDKDDHTSGSSRYKYGLEKTLRKREYKQRECTLCKASGLPAMGHNMRTCALNPNRNK